MHRAGWTPGCRYVALEQQKFLCGRLRRPFAANSLGATCFVGVFSQIDVRELPLSSAQRYRICVQRVKPESQICHFRPPTPMDSEILDGSTNGHGRGMRPLVFGEVLFDLFPERSVLGGAPFNVAWSLRKFGLDPLMVTAVGQDPQGASIRARMELCGMDTDGLQVCADRPTGRVEIQLEEGQPRYDIVRDQAYDFIESPDLANRKDDFALLYHGSLAWRSERSRTTLRNLISTSKLARFVDVNVRQPHFELAWLEELLPGASWVKVNDDELAMIAGSSVEAQEEIAQAVGILSRRFGPAVYFVTAGSHGAYLVQGDDVHFQPAPKPPRLQDTVGAGDAFAAMAIEGIIVVRELTTTIRRSVEFAARVCSIPGATSEETSLYTEIT